MPFSNFATPEKTMDIPNTHPPSITRALKFHFPMDHISVVKRFKNMKSIMECTTTEKVIYNGSKLSLVIIFEPLQMGRCW
jgi:hypothetical protein